jgi:hypothetical protein
MTTATVAMDAQEQIARIERMNAETRKFVEKAMKLSAEQAKLGRDRALAPWQIVLSGMTAGAACFGAGVAFIKLLGS